MRSVSRPLLSARQAEIAELLAAGKSNAEIAESLRLSERTIESHVAALFNKLGVGSRTEVVAAILRSPWRETQGFAARTNLRHQTSALIGRESDVAQLDALLKRGRLVTLMGAGGVGKTRAALAVGDALLESAETRVWFVELAPVTEGSFVAAAVAQTLHVDESPNRPLLETIVANLKQKALLLILDNCEHVIAEAAALVDALLGGCPRLRILATSREPLRIAGEQTYRLPSLPVPIRSQIVGMSATRAAEFAAVMLFAMRARAVDHAFTLSDENSPDVAEICRRLDGIPLAIELAAARVKILSLRELSTKLDQRFRLRKRVRDG